MSMPICDCDSELSYPTVPTGETYRLIIIVAT